MLIHAGCRNPHVKEIPGEIHIVLSVQKDGSFLLSGYLLGEWNTTYGRKDGDSLLSYIPGLLNELREDLAKAKSQA